MPHAVAAADLRLAERRLALIYNPTAGSRRARAVREAAERLGDRWRVTVRETGRRGDAERGAAAAPGEGFDAIAVAGGDGTINEAINGLAGAPTPLGVLPFGTANVLSHEIGIRGDLARALTAIREGHTRTIHLGACNGRLFSMMAGVGFDAHVVRDVDLGLKRRIGKLAYVWQSTRQWLRHAPTPYAVRIDGSPAHGTGAMIVANGRYYGGPWIACARARLDQPDFEVCRFPTTSRYAVLRYMARIGLGVLEHAGDVALQPARRIEIDGPEGEPVQADGDIVATLPARIDASAARIEVFVPN